MQTKPSSEKQRGVRPPTTPPKPPMDKKAKEVLREQAKTETETRPYLDTEGGE
jgi:hypothetical protein